jgi:hypothetical protein
LLVGCAAEPAPAPPERAAWKLRELPAEQSPTSRARARVARAEGQDADWTILSLHQDGSVLYGRARPPQAGYHGWPQYDVRLLAEGAQATTVVASPRDGSPNIDAALAPAGDPAVALVTAERELVLWRPNAPAVMLDNEVVPGLSFSADGRRLVYAKGTQPELDIFLVQVPATISMSACRGEARKKTPKRSRS